jgi:hypothetical protein
MQYEPLKPGIYFGLSEKRYHTDPAISRSDILNIMDSPNTYWENSHLNPNRKTMAERRVDEDDKYELVLGRAYHCMIFEPASFRKRFWLFPTEKQDHARQMITDIDYQRILESIKILRAGKDSNRFLSNLFPEVTIIFDDMGVRYRTRHDGFGLVASTEFKSARSLDVGYLKKEFRIRGIDIQMALYLRARERFKEQYLAKEAEVYGAVPPNWFRTFMRQDMNEFVVIFQRKTKPFPFQPLLPEDDTKDSGEIKIRVNTNIYKYHLEKFGNKPWPVSEGRIKRFSMNYGIIEE